MTCSLLTHVFRTAGVVLVPAVILLCCAGRADAGCGDYVQIVGADGKVQSPAGHDSMPGERPCQGPECTGGPKAPAPVSPAPPSPPSDVKALVADGDEADSPPAGSRPACDVDRLPVRQPSLIFHPPRFS